MADYLENQIEISEANIQYDAQAKAVLADKEVLAWILRGVVKECQDLSIPTIQAGIGATTIGATPIIPGKTTQAINGSANENKVVNEGVVNFDVLFPFAFPGKNEATFIINVEAQRKHNPGYDLVTRALFYCARLISSQLNKDFEIPKYNDIKPVYSIWLCFNAPEALQGKMVKYSLASESSDEIQERLKHLHIVMVYPKNEPDLDGSSLMQMLSVLFSKLDATQKETILYEKFHFTKSDTREEALHHMCNLSLNITEEALKKGIQQGKHQANLDMVRNLLANGVPSDVIRNSLPDLSDSEFADLLKEAKETENEKQTTQKKQ